MSKALKESQEKKPFTPSLKSPSPEIEFFHLDGIDSDRDASPTKDSYKNSSDSEEEEKEQAPYTDHPMTRSTPALPILSPVGSPIDVRKSADLDRRSISAPSFAIGRPFPKPRNTTEQGF